MPTRRALICFRLALFVGALLLLLALGRNPYGYYNFLRLYVTALSLYGAYVASGLERQRWFAFFCVTAILFNPLFPIHLTRDLWAVVDVVLAGVLLASLVLFRVPVRI